MPLKLSHYGKFPVLNLCMNKNAPKYLYIACLCVAHCQLSFRIITLCRYAYFFMYKKNKKEMNLEFNI